MAQIVTDQILGKVSEGLDEEIDMSTKLKLIGVDVASFGDALDRDNTFQSIVVEDKLNKIYKRLNISQDGQHLMGGILVGDASEYNSFFQLFKNQIPLGDNPESLLTGSGGGAEIGIDALPDDAIICTCESVTKGQICGVIQNGCHTMGDVVSETKASSGCCLLYTSPSPRD